MLDKEKNLFYKEKMKIGTFFALEDLDK